MRKTRLFSILALLLMAATGAWAQTETLLTTITPTGKDTYSETPAGVVTVTPSNMRRYNGDYGWLWSGSGSVTVEAKEGYTITRCVFKQNEKTPVTITTSPFEITFDARGDCVQNDVMDGVTSIEVYGPAAPTATGYSVTLAEGTDDAGNWTISPATAEEGQTVTIKYNGTKKVKSVKAVKKAPAKVTAITLNKTETSIKVGSTETLSVTAVAPDNATDKTYTWKTSDASKATVDQDGKVTAVAVGTVTIYAEANDGSGVTATCAVTVTPKLYSFTITGPYTGNQLVVEFYEGDTWNDMITKYSSTLKKIRKWVGFSTDGNVTDPKTNEWVEVTDQLVPNRDYYVR